MALEQHTAVKNAISELISGIIKGKQDGMYTLAVFLDLSKAFDSLEHDVLLKKLYKYGIRGIALKWYKSYLTDRTMRVKCNVASSGKTEYSTYLNITYGTPAGILPRPTNLPHLHKRLI